MAALVIAVGIVLLLMLVVAVWRRWSTRRGGGGGHSSGRAKLGDSAAGAQWRLHHASL